MVDLWSKHRFVLVADFRREYGLSWDDTCKLTPVEWAQLTLGISVRSRLVTELQGKKPKAAAPKTVEEYQRAVARHRGRFKVVDGSASKSDRAASPPSTAQEPA